MTAHWVVGEPSAPRVEHNYYENALQEIINKTSSLNSPNSHSRTKY